MSSGGCGRAICHSVLRQLERVPMAHVKLLSLALALLTGVWVSAIAHQRAQSYAYRFLRPIADYTVIFNVGMLSLFFARYLDVNLPGQFFKEHAAAFRNLADLAISVLV